MTRRALFATVFGVVTTRPAAAQSGFIATGRLTDGGEEGCYAFGQELAILAKPKSTAQAQFDALLNRDVEITVRPL
jgi:hypothetical protein